MDTSPPDPERPADTPRPEVDVVAGIWWREPGPAGPFLAVRRPEGKPLAGFWEFPGGKVEPGETREQALVREFQEELGLTPERFEFWRSERHEYEHLCVRLHFFHIHACGGDLHAREGHATAWMTPRQARGRRFLPADTAIVNALDAQAKQ
jgi:8-oxo-dGTP diphosphatase